MDSNILLKGPIALVKAASSLQRAEQAVEWALKMLGLFWEFVEIDECDEEIIVFASFDDLKKTTT